jgi:hypothetical protein
VEVKYEMHSEPEAKRKAIEYYKALEYALKKSEESFDDIIPTVVFGAKGQGKIISRYYKLVLHKN